MGGNRRRAVAHKRQVSTEPVRLEQACAGPRRPSPSLRSRALNATPFKVLLSKRLYAPDSIEESGERRSGKPLLSDLRSMRRRA
jgi:hypothetical protein